MTFLALISANSLVDSWISSSCVFFRSIFHLFSFCLVFLALFCLFSRTFSPHPRILVQKHPGFHRFFSFSAFSAFSSTNLPGSYPIGCINSACPLQQQKLLFYHGPLIANRLLVAFRGVQYPKIVPLFEQIIFIRLSEVHGF